MKLYRHPRGNSRKFVGGMPMNRIWNKVTGAARRFAQSSFGRKLGTLAKRQILKIGANAVDRILSGADSGRALKRSADALTSQLKGPSQKRFKRTILGRNKSKTRKLGGLTLYRLAKKKGSRKRGRKQSRKRGRKLGREILYRLNKARKRAKANKWDDVRFRLSSRKKYSKNRKKIAKLRKSLKVVNRGRRGKKTTRKGKSGRIRVRRGRRKKGRRKRRSRKKIKPRRSRRFRRKLPTSIFDR